MKKHKLIGGVWERMESCQSTVTKTEKKLIEALRGIEPKNLIYMSITELADVTGVAEATIVRFCRNLELKGFQDFKLKLSRETVSVTETEGGAADKARAAADEMKDSISRTSDEIDYNACLEIASKISSAKRIFLSAVGNSAVAALALKIKLLSAGINADTSSDPHIQSIAVANMTGEDLVILISVSGSTKDTLSVAETAKKRGVPTVVITNHLKSPLVRYADYVLYNCRKQAPYAGGSLATVVSQIYIADVLCAAVFEKLAGLAETRAAQASEAVSDKLL